jgi:hypothetical protein
MNCKQGTIESWSNTRKAFNRLKRNVLQSWSLSGGFRHWFSKVPGNPTVIRDYCCYYYVLLLLLLLLYKAFRLYSLHNLQIFLPGVFVYILYFTLARSKMEYVSVVWNSVTSTDSTKLERIQQKFASVVFIVCALMFHILILLPWRN